jgi:hypothetical protein
MNSKTVQKIVQHAVDKLRCNGYNTVAFKVSKAEEGIFGNTPWHDFVITEYAEDPVVFSLLTEDDADSDNGLVLSVMDTASCTDEINPYKMDTKQFKPCHSEEEVVETLVMWYHEENTSENAGKGKGRRIAE